MGIEDEMSSLFSPEKDSSGASPVRSPADSSLTPSQIIEKTPGMILVESRLGEPIEKILSELWKKEGGVARVAKALGIRDVTASEWLHRSGLRLIPEYLKSTPQPEVVSQRSKTEEGDGRKYIWSGFSEERREEIRERRKEGSRRYREELEKDPERKKLIRQHMSEVQLKGSLVKRLGENYKEKLEEMAKQGLTKKQIAALCNVKRVASVQHWMDFLGIEYKRSGRSPRNNLEVAKRAEELGLLDLLKGKQAEIIRGRYLAERTSTLQETADKYEISRQSIKQTESGTINRLITLINITETVRKAQEAGDFSHLSPREQEVLSKVFINRPLQRLSSILATRSFTNRQVRYDLNQALKKLKIKHDLVPFT